MHKIYLGEDLQISTLDFTQSIWQLPFYSFLNSLLNFIYFSSLTLPNAWVL